MPLKRQRSSIDHAADVLFGRVGPYSGVSYKSESLKHRESLLAWMEEVELTGSRGRTGNYWKIKELEATLEAYAEKLADSCSFDGVLEAAEDYGLLTFPKDVLSGDSLRRLHYVYPDNGDTCLHRTVRQWVGASTDSMQEEAMDRLRALCLAGADLEALNAGKETAVVVAIKLDAVEPLRTLLEFEAHVPQASLTESDPLLVAAEVNSSSSFAVLAGYAFEHGVLPKLAWKRNFGGLTVLHLAAINDSVKVLETALSFSAYRNRKLLDTRAARVKKATSSLPSRASSIHDLLQPAIAKAARYGHVRSLALLLDAGATPDVVDASGRSALHIASEKGYVKSVKLLLKYGADPALLDARQRSPRDHCLLGQSNKTVRREPLEDLLAGLKTVYSSKKLKGSRSTRTLSSSSFAEDDFHASNVPTTNASSSSSSAAAGNHVVTVKDHVDYPKCLKILDAMETYRKSTSNSFFAYFFGSGEPPLMVEDDDDTVGTRHCCAY